MNLIEKEQIIPSFKNWGRRSSCNCAEFSFNNTSWTTSKFKIGVTGIISALFLGIGCVIIEENVKLSILCVLTVFISIGIVKLLLCVKKETLYVIPPVGVQFITTHVIGSESVLFVPWHYLKNFVIVEVIVGQQVLFYLAIQSKTNTDDGLLILFPNTKPRLSHLEKMYRAIVEHLLN